MGAKYLPTVKDQRAAQRFQLRQSGLKKARKSGGRLVSPPARRK
jgi:hypothetical protein